MNHLAHLLTAGDDESVRLGVLLGDHVRGKRVLEDYPEPLAMGILLHRAVDSYTDQYPALAAARDWFEPPFRRYAGIMLDVYWDHLLSRDWETYCPDTPLPAFAARTLDMLNRHFAELPRGLQRFTRYARVTGVLGRYGEADMLEQVFAGIAQRLRHQNPLADALPELRQREAELSDVFVRFFPDLLEYARRWRRDYRPEQAA